MNSRKKTTLFAIIIIGIVVPFIPSFVVIEMFYLLIPFVLIGVGTLIYLIASFTNAEINSRKAFFAFSILPIFIISQLISGFVVNKIQRFRSNQVITEIEIHKSETGTLPDNYELIGGLEYNKMKDNQNFIIKYSRGFMTTEEYNSRNSNWRSYGWND